MRRHTLSPSHAPSRSISALSKSLLNAQSAVAGSSSTTHYQYVFQVVPVSLIVLIGCQKPRDPRFMHAAGRYDPAKFKQQYDFITGLHRDELSTLREHVKRAQKLLANSPAHLRAEREEEVKRLERTMKRAESAVNRDNWERIESNAVRSAKQAEREKRNKGKAEWWMKRCELRMRPLSFPQFTCYVDSRKESPVRQGPHGCHRIGWW